MVTIDVTDPDYVSNPLFTVEFYKNKIYNYKFSFYCSNNKKDKNFNDASYARYPPITTEYIEI